MKNLKTPTHLLSLLLLAFLLIFSSCSKNEVDTGISTSTSTSITSNTLTANIFPGANSFSFKIYNGSTAAHTYTTEVIFKVNNLVQNIIASVESYTISGDTYKKDIPVRANSTSTVDLSFILKDGFAAALKNQLLTATISVYEDTRLLKSEILNIGTLTTFADIVIDTDPTKPTTYDPSTTAKYKSISGYALVKGAVINLVEAGVVKVEVLGTMQDGSSPIAEYKVSKLDDSDFYFSAAKVNDFISRTGVTEKVFTLNLKKGINVIYLKTKGFKGKIAASTKIGIRVSTASKVIENTAYTADASYDHTEKVVVVNMWLGGQHAGPGGPTIKAQWGTLNIYPTDKNYNFIDNFPLIVNLGLSTKYYKDKYPFLEFGRNHENGVKAFSLSVVDINTPGYDEKGYHWRYYDNTDKVYDKVNNIIYLTNINFNFYIFNPEFKYQSITFYTDVWNTSSQDFAPGGVGIDPASKGWELRGYPELELGATTHGSGFGNAADALYYADQVLKF